MLKSFYFSASQLIACKLDQAPLSAPKSMPVQNAIAEKRISSSVLPHPLSHSFSQSRRTQRPVESTDTVHVLSVFGLLVLPHTIQLVIPRHFCVFGTPEADETHHPLHRSLLILVGIDHLSRRFFSFHWFAIAGVGCAAWCAWGRTLACVVVVAIVGGAIGRARAVLTIVAV